MAGSFNYIPAPKARRLALIATIITALLCVFALMSVNGKAAVFSFIMVPTFAIYLWPQGANPLISLIGIVAVGLWLDHISFGPMGLWAMTWLMLFLIYRPDARAKPQGFLGQMLGAVLVLMGVSVFHILLGATLLGRSIDVFSIAYSALTASLVFPLFYVIREFLARSYGERDEYYYEAPNK